MVGLTTACFTSLDELGGPGTLVFKDMNSLFSGQDWLVLAEYGMLLPLPA